jgi:acid stress chaperone HdeB
MKLTLTLAAAAMLLAGSARADDMDFSVITCKDFISSQKSDIAIVLAWLEGYYTKENDPPILHSDKMGTDAKNLSDYCNKHPGDGLITAAEAVMPVK